MNENDIVTNDDLILNFLNEEEERKDRIARELAMEGKGAGRPGPDNPWNKPKQPEPMEPKQD